jgi:hypothetical protein
MVERRAVKRARLRRAAWILGSAGEKIVCVLSNLSEGGAQLELLSCDALPEQFTLSVEGRPRLARIAWRRRWRVGVTFEEDEQQLVA